MQPKTAPATAPATTGPRSTGAAAAGPPAAAPRGDELPDRDHAGRAIAESVRAHGRADLVAGRARHHRPPAGPSPPRPVSGISTRGAREMPWRARRYAGRMDPRCGSSARWSPSSTPGPSPGAATCWGVAGVGVADGGRAGTHARAPGSCTAPPGRSRLTPVGARVVGHARRVLKEVAASGGWPSRRPPELRVGFAWAALGRYTRGAAALGGGAPIGAGVRPVQRPDRRAQRGYRGRGGHPPAGRRSAVDHRAGRDRARFAALATDNPLARKRSVRLGDLAGRTVAVDERTGTTSGTVGPGPHRRPRTTHGVEDWLTVIAAGQAVGVTSEATRPEPAARGRLPARPGRPAGTGPARLVGRRPAARARRPARARPRGVREFGAGPSDRPTR